MSHPSESTLFKPMRIGRMDLQNRLVLAPLTRFRATDEHVPDCDLMLPYYEQRGSVPGTLLITEGTAIHPRAAGYENVPGLWNDDQIASWRRITAAVHAKGSFIYNQLWAMGRAAVPSYTKAHGIDVVSSSALPMPPSEAEARPTHGAVPKEMTEQDIHDFIGYYVQAARNAIAAGFDGVEIHAANGYLIDQFTQDVVNKRTDAWGGSVEKRSRFALEIAKRCADAIGADRVGIRLSPFSTFQGMKMEPQQAREEQFGYLVRELRKLGLAYLHVVESRIQGSADTEATADRVDFMLDIWQGKTDGEGKLLEPNHGAVLIAGGFTPASAIRAVDEELTGRNVAIVFGRYWISTPDLVYRVKHGIELTPYDRKTFYVPKERKGYSDYPFSKEFEREFGVRVQASM